MTLEYQADPNHAVKATPPVRHLTRVEPVLKLFRNHNKKILDVSISDNEGQSEILGATPEHPFFVRAHGWVKAANLKPGDVLESHQSGEGLKGALLVKAINERPGKSDTYNFEVAETHTYFVGKLSTWVHNTCSAKDLLDNGGRHLDQDTIVGAYGNKYIKQPDGTFLKVGKATDAEISQSGVSLRPDPSQTSAARAVDNLLKPNGNYVGVVNSGATENIRTVSSGEFGVLKNELLNGATATGTYAGGKGTWYSLPRGGRVGVRASDNSGLTMDIDIPGYPKGFKVHQK